MGYYTEMDITRFTREASSRIKDIVVEEYPLTVFVNSWELVTLLCSPVDLDFLVTGFLVSEGFIGSVQDIISMEINQKLGRADVKVMETADFVGKDRDRRTVTTSSARGSVFYNLKDADKLPVLSGGMPEVDYDTVIKLIDSFNEKCTVFRKTGGVHACAFALGEDIRVFHQDIGRHNAMDKVIGHCMQASLDFRSGLVMSSGRIASEMLLKAAKRGISVFVSRAAPTMMSVDIARKLNITLIGFAREDRFNVYHDAGRIK